MAYQRRYLQQTQASTFKAGTAATPGTPDVTTTTYTAVRTPVQAPGYRTGYTTTYVPTTTVTPGTPSTPATTGSQTIARLRRGEMAGGDLRLQMAEGKRRLRIEPSDLGQRPGDDLPPPGADGYDPFSASEAEGLAGLRRKRGGGVDLSINASNASVGINTL